MVPTQLPSPETTIVVILGASEFPRISEFNSVPAFKSSASRFKEYLLDNEGFNLPQANLLDLFDSEDPQSIIDEKISGFIDNRLNESMAKNQQLYDILVYYVGHGGFTDDGRNDYFLALRSTREQQKSGSGYLIRSLAQTLKQYARHLRKYLVLDCCFAAAAYESFQSAPLEVATRQTLEEFPSKGTCLFCAASRIDPAVVLPNYSYTAFSTALIDILTLGASNEQDMLSFDVLGQLCHWRLKEVFADQAVRPEIHSPDQRKGDIAKLPFFPNQANKRLALKRRIETLEGQLSQLVLEQKEQTRQIDALTNIVNDLKKQVSRYSQLVSDQDDKVMFATNGTELEASLADIFVGYYGLSHHQWSLLTESKKRKLVDCVDSRRRLLKTLAVYGSLFAAIFVILLLLTFSEHSLIIRSPVILPIGGLIVSTTFFAIFLTRYLLLAEPQEEHAQETSGFEDIMWDMPRSVHEDLREVMLRVRMPFTNEEVYFCRRDRQKMLVGITIPLIIIMVFSFYIWSLL